MKQEFKRLFSFIYPVYYKRGVLVLNYHSVNPSHKFSTSPYDFEEQMLFLKENYEVISLNDLNAPGFNPLMVDKVKVIITFDDGYEDNFLYAYPILKKYNLPAIIFITTDFIFNNVDITKDWPVYNNLKPLKPEQIKEMLSNKISIGSHSKTHYRSSSLSAEEFASELSKSQQDIEKYIGIKIDTFAFPFGQKKDCVQFDQSIFTNNNYQIVCTTSWGINYKNYDQFKLKRIRIDYFDSLKDFKNKLRGKWDFVKYFQALKNLL